MLTLTNADLAESAQLASMVFRLPKTRLDAVKALSRATRIRQSEYLREAISDLLKKHAEALR